MKPVHVNFVPPRRWPARWMNAVSVLLLLVAAHQGWQAWESYQQLKRTQALIAQVRAQAEQMALQQRERAAKNVESDAARRERELAARLAAFPLDQVFASVESAQVSGVVVTLLDIDAAEGTVRLEVEFVDLDALLKYVSALNAGEPTPRWRLWSTRAGQQGQPGKGALNGRWH